MLSALRIGVIPLFGGAPAPIERGSRETMASTLTASFAPEGHRNRPTLSMDTTMSRQCREVVGVMLRKGNGAESWRPGPAQVGRRMVTVVPEPSFKIGLTDGTCGH